MSLTQLKQGIDWVGYVDWDIRDFHSYNTTRGATYNAYLIADQHSVLIDTVKAPYSEALLRQLAQRMPLEEIRYVVCNHAEPDHASALPKVLPCLPNATLVCNQRCATTLGQYFDTSTWSIEIVKSGDRLSLGQRTLEFMDTPMVHWPESMFTYVPEDGLLFSMDAFGQHIASSERFDDQYDFSVLMAEARTYYANIVMPFFNPVRATLKKAEGLVVNMIAPSHGLIWRANPGAILQAYDDWCHFRPAAKVVVVYDSMWGSTRQLAQAIVEGASSESVSVKSISVRDSTLTHIATEILDCAGAAFGSPTLNGEMMPEMAAVMTYLKGLNPQNKFGVAFGSYGWSKGGPKALHNCLEAMKWELLEEAPLETQYAPTSEDLDRAREVGQLLAKNALAALGN